MALDTILIIGFVTILLISIAFHVPGSDVDAIRIFRTF